MKIIVEKPNGPDLIKIMKKFSSDSNTTLTHKVNGNVEIVIADNVDKIETMTPDELFKKFKIK